MKPRRAWSPTRGTKARALCRSGRSAESPSGDNGAEIFQRIREGNGTFVTSAAAANGGTLVPNGGTVTNPQAWANPANSQDYMIRFHVDPSAVPSTTYDIVDNSSGTSMLTGVAAVAGPHARAFQPGGTIALQRQAGDPALGAFDAGAQISVTGTPASGDTIQLRQAGTRDIFASLNDVISALESGTSTAASSHAAYQNKLNQAMTNIDRGLDQVLTARSSIGSRLQEIDALQTTTENLAVHYEEELSRLQDLDYAQALTDLQRRQFNLEAAQKSFMLVNSLRLFDLL